MKVYFIGAGPGAVDLITVRGREILEKASVVLWPGSLVNPAFLDLARSDAETHDTSRLSLEQQIEADQSSPSKRARRGEALELLERAVKELPDDQREAVRLRYMRGWSLEQLAGRLDRSETAVAGLLKRGLQALRNRFEVEQH